MNRGGSHILPHKLKPLVEEIFILLSPPITDDLSVEVWIEPRLVRIICQLLLVGMAMAIYEPIATYSTVFIPVAYCTMIRVYLGIPVGTKFTVEICEYTYCSSPQN